MGVANDNAAGSSQPGNNSEDQAAQQEQVQKTELLAPDFTAISGHYAGYPDLDGDELKAEAI
jgi:hypothetical protein